MKSTVLIGGSPWYSRFELVGAVLGRHPNDVLALVPDLTFGDFIALATCDGRGQRTFSRSIRAHDSVDFAFVDAQIQSFQDFLASDGDV